MAGEGIKAFDLVTMVKGWPRSRQISLISVALIVLTLFIWILMQAKHVQYRTLYQNLSQEQASSVVEWLENEGVPYELRDEGRNISVPANRVYSTRLKMAGSGIPKEGGVGFEIFDEQSFGVTQFSQDVNYLRALQGELARTISSMGPIRSSRIHLVVPEERLLQRQQREAKASVMLHLKDNQSLDQNQIQGIVYLVSGSIKGLKQENITVVDNHGRMLTKNNAGDGSPVSQHKIEYMHNVQEKMEEKAQSLLDMVFGPGQAMVRVTADIDFSQQQTIEETFDPRNVVPRSEHSISERTDMFQERGVPGAESNVGNADLGAQTRQPSERSEDVINFEIGRRVEETTHPMGRVKNVSVAVLVAQAGGESQDSVAGDAYQAQLQSVESMISSALGLSEQRGDKIEVVSMPFKEGLFKEMVVEKEEAMLDMPFDQLVKYGFLLIGLVLLYFLLLRPLIRTLQGEMQEHGRSSQELDSGQQTVKILKNEPIEQLRQEIVQSQVSPGQVVKAWIKEG